MFIFSKLKNYLLAAVFALLPIFYVLGRFDSNKRNKFKELKTENKTLEKANEVSNEIQIMDDDGITRELSKWMRDK